MNEHFSGGAGVQRRRRGAHVSPEDKRALVFVGDGSRDATSAVLTTLTTLAERSRRSPQRKRLAMTPREAGA